MKYMHFLPVVRGGLGLMTGAITGVTGTVVISAEKLWLSEAAAMSVLGNSLLYGVFGAKSGVLSRIGFFRKSSQDDPSVGFLTHTGLQVLGGMLGYVIKSTLDQADTSCNTLATTLLVGAMVSALPLWLMNIDIRSKMTAFFNNAERQLHQLDKLDEYGEGYDDAIKEPLSALSFRAG